MIRRVLPSCLLLVVAGCWPSEERSALVSPNPFGAPPPAQSFDPKHVVNAPASEEAGKHVSMVGLKVMEANRQTGLRPAFLTIGVPQPEIFHRGTSEVWITEGLVRQCKTDGQLAAVLCHELGKMVSEREALASPAARLAERGPPIDVPVGKDSGGAFGPADGTRLAELAKYEKDRHNRDVPPLPPPDPDVLARTYFLNTDYPRDDLDAVAPLLREAEKNYSFEKTILAPARTTK